MSEEGEKTCPLCAEEMDLTDQQLKPCKCGYEICVWCWHHIMNMAEKDETEGRCPACRNPYNKEKIVGTAANCERLVSEMNVEKKKLHKGKNKTSEGRKHLASVRVIQRNLVYVVGLPLNFADEDLLQRKEYFGQYGKVLKVSISRTAAGAIQHFANSTCSVYITFSKEEEAVRCIQLVHGFVLDGRPLKACFGTTKYCHAWLRNVPCSNPECLYLHEIGSQEDSFTKDEIISAYTRVQQITGSSNSTQWRSGNVLPPPVDEYCNNNASSGKPITKTAVNTNSLAVNARISPPNSSSGRSVALPAGASWGSRASNNQPLLGSRQCPNVPAKQKSDVCNGPVACSTAAASPSQLSSLRSDTGKMLVPNEGGTISKNKSKNETLETETLETGKKESDLQRRITVSESSIASVHSATLLVNRQPHNQPSTKPPPNSVNIVDSSLPSNGFASDKDSGDATDGNIKNICSDILSMGIHENQIQDNGSGQHIRETVTSQMTGTDVNKSTAAGFSDVQPDIRLGMPTQVTQVDLPEIEDDLLSFEKQRLKDPEVTSIRIPEFSQMSPPSKHSNIHSSQFSNADSSISVDVDRQVVDRNGNLMNSTFHISSGYAETILEIPEVNDVEYSNLFPSKEKGLLPGRYKSEVASGASDIGESSIITNILSMDFDTWDEPLTSSQNLATLLGDTDKRQGSLGLPGSLKIQNNNQSRFSFAREESMSQVSKCGNSVDYFEKGYKQHSLGFDISNRSGLQLEKFLNFNGFPVTNSLQSDVFAGSHSVISSNRLSGSRSQISAPPGFSMPSRAPPPGFNSHERTLQNLETHSGNPTLDVSSMLRNHYQAPSDGCSSISNDDIEFIDPAILAVGKGMVPGAMNSPGADLRSSYSQQLNTSEEAGFQSFLRSSLPPHHNQGRTNLGSGYSSLGDAYGIPSRVAEQTLTNNLSPFSQFALPQSRNGMTSNGQWDGWNEIQRGNNLGVEDLLRTERLGFSKLYGGFEDSKIQLPGSGNLYHRTYGI